MNELKIGGKVMPPVQKLTISKEPVWSKNAGRGADGTMIGDIVARKTKLEITFVPLTDEMAVLLDAAITPAFFSVTFKDPATGKEETKTMYAGSPAYPVYSYAAGFKRYVGTAVNLIEQ